jgi:hypothetical protein
VKAIFQNQLVALVEQHEPYIRQQQAQKKRLTKLSDLLEERYRSVFIFIVHSSLMPCADTIGSRLGSVPLSAFTAEEVQAILARAHIAYDTSLGAVCDGATLAMCDDEYTIMSTLGVQQLGDCTRLLHLLHPPPRADTGSPQRDPWCIFTSLAAHYDEAVPACNSWTVEQVSRWLQASGLDELVEPFAQHKISGDVVTALNLTVGLVVFGYVYKLITTPQVVAGMLRLSAQTKARLKTAIEDLRRGQTPDIAVQPELDHFMEAVAGRLAEGSIQRRASSRLSSVAMSRDEIEM